MERHQLIEVVLNRLENRVVDKTRQRLRRVINGTGINPRPVLAGKRKNTSDKEESNITRSTRI